MGTGELSGRPHKMLGGGGSNTPCRLILHGTGRFELYISSLVKRFETSLVFPARLKYLNLGINLCSRGGGGGEDREALEGERETGRPRGFKYLI